MFNFITDGCARASPMLTAEEPSPEPSRESDSGQGVQTRSAAKKWRSRFRYLYLDLPCTAYRQFLPVQPLNAKGTKMPPAVRHRWVRILGRICLLCIFYNSEHFGQGEYTVPIKLEYISTVAMAHCNIIDSL